VNYTAQLKAEGNLLRRSEPKGKAPRKRIRKVSKRRERQNREYTVRRKAFLEAHPFCQVWLKRMGFTEQEAFAYSGHFNSLHCPRSEEVHHANKRTGDRLNDERYWVAASSAEHRWIHAHPSEARKLGLLL